MEKIIAKQNFNLKAEGLKVKKDDELLIADVVKTEIDEKGNITINEERAEQIIRATFEGKPLGIRVVVEDAKKEENASNENQDASVQGEPKAEGEEEQPEGEPKAEGEEDKTTLKIETADLKSDKETADLKVEKGTKKGNRK